MAYRARKSDGQVTDALQWDPATAREWLDSHGVTPPAPVEGEECPYCRDVVLGLVGHLQRCPERPGFVN
jgi:hypothetical protein